jgi:hypothetical protein
MFKLVVLSCIVSVAFAGHLYAPASYAVEKTIIEPHSTIVETPTISHVGSVVKSIPTAHSYQSQTQYHSKTIAEPILAHGVQKTVVSTPIVKQYVEQVPAAVKVIAEPAYVHAAPVAYAAHHVAAPLKTVSYHGNYAAPLTYAHAAPVYSHAAYAAAPVAYAAPAAYGHHW